MANPAKAGDAKPRGYRTLRRAKPVELPNLLGGVMYFYSKGYRFPTAVALLAACEIPRRTSSTGVDNPVAQVVVYPDTLTLDPLQNFQFGAFGHTAAGDSVPVSVHWVASAGLISQGGMYTADTSGTDVIVTATLANSTVSGTSQVKKRRLVKILINPKNTALAVGGFQQFAVYGLKNTGDSVSVSVTYSATGGTISGSGAYTAGRTTGSYRVIAKQNGGALADTSAVTVLTIPVASVVVSPASGTLAPGATLQLSAATLDSAGNPLSGRTVSWSSSAPSEATVSAGALVTGVAAGNATITATSGGKSGTADVTVSAPPPPPPPPPPGSPGTVTDLAVASITDNAATLSFTEVNNGSGAPASYDIRLAVGTISWGSAPSVTQGTCQVPVSGTAIGAKRSCTVLGLAASTAYQFQLIAFQGTLNVNAIFGLVSNVASGTTTGSITPPPPPPPPSPPGTWPNEPAGFRMISDQPWDAMLGTGWSYLRRTSTKDDGIVADLTAPFSLSNVLRIVFTAGCCVDAEPSVHWMTMATVREIYTGWWMKLSPNWQPNPAGGGKITFLWTNNSTGQVYTNLYHPCAYPESCGPDVQGPPYKIGANTEWGPYGQKIWYPNVTTTWVNPGEWHRIEFYYRWETTPGSSGDGIIRWWVDGVLNGNYTNVHYPNAAGFSQFDFEPTKQSVSSEQYMYIDHTYVSVP